MTNQSDGNSAFKKSMKDMFAQSLFVPSEKDKIIYK